MNDWPVLTLDELSATEPRAITDGPFGSNLARHHYTDHGPRVVRLQNIGDGEFIDAKAHISKDHFESLRKHEVLVGDLLIASLGEVLPRACLAPDWLGSAIVKADCIRVRLGDRVEAKWVLYALRRPEARRWVDAHRHGVGRPRIGLKTIRQIPIPVPPIEEQRRIVATLEDHLSRLDAGRTYLRAGIDRIGLLTRSALDREFGLRDQDGVPLGELVREVSAGKSFGSSAGPAGLGEWGIVKVSAMTYGTFRPDENKAVDGSQVDSRFEIREGDLLVSRANTNAYVGASVLVGPVRPRLLLSDKSLRVVPHDGVRTDWLWRALQAPSARTQISQLATGTKDSMRNISQAALLQVRIPQADRDQQADAVRNFDLADGQLERVRGELRIALARGDSLRRATLAAAFSGELTSR